MREVKTVAGRIARPVALLVLLGINGPMREGREEGGGREGGRDAEQRGEEEAIHRGGNLFWRTPPDGLRWHLRPSLHAYRPTNGRIVRNQNATSMVDERGRARAFSRGARGGTPRKKTAFSRGARGGTPRKKTTFSRGARGDTPRKRKFEAEGCDCGALPWNKRVRGASATRRDCSMVDERGRATGEAEGCDCGAPTSVNSTTD